MIVLAATDPLQASIEAAQQLGLLAGRTHSAHVHNMVRSDVSRVGFATDAGAILRASVNDILMQNRVPFYRSHDQAAESAFRLLLHRTWLEHYDTALEAAFEVAINAPSQGAV